MDYIPTIVVALILSYLWSREVQRADREKSRADAATKKVQEFKEALKAVHDALDQATQAQRLTGETLRVTGSEIQQLRDRVSELESRNRGYAREIEEFFDGAGLQGLISREEIEAAPEPEMPGLWEVLGK